MDTEDRIDQLIEAQDLLRQAVELLKDAFKGTDIEAYAEAYLIAAIESRIDNETWVTGDETIQNYIERFQDPDYGLEESDDTEDAELVEGFDDEIELLDLNEGFEETRGDTL